MSDAMAAAANVPSVVATGHPHDAAAL